MAGAVTPRRPDQGDPGPSTGLGGGFRSGILRARVVIVSGVNEGVFVYNGPPALGNLIASITSADGIDVYGNAFVHGVVSYFPSAAPPRAVQLGSPNAAPGITFLQAATVAGPWTDVVQLVGDPATAALVVINNLSVANNLDVALQLTATGGTAGSPTLITTDTWHPLALDAGWTAGSPAPSVRLLPDGNLQLTGLATHAAITTETALNSGTPLVAPYVPATNKNYQGNRAGGTAGAEIKSTGVVFAEPNGVSSTSVDITGTVPLNL